MSTENNAEKLLKMAADMQDFDEIPDELTEMIKEYGEAELSVEEMDNVMAASSAPAQSLSKFLEMMKKS